MAKKIGRSLRHGEERRCFVDLAVLRTLAKSKKLEIKQKYVRMWVYRIMVDTI